jgi:hypothetical protein
LRELLESSPEDPVVVTEGEKCAEAAARCGLVAVTSIGGSHGQQKTDWSPLRGRKVIILPDNDLAGKKHTDKVLALCRQAGAASVKILRLADFIEGFPEGGDIADVVESPQWLQRLLGEGATLDDLRDWILARGDELPEASVPETKTDSRLVCEPVVVSLSDVEPESVRWLWPNRIPLGRITLVVGRPGVGKSFVCMDIAARVTTGTAWPDEKPCEKGSVVILSLEDDPADTIRPRLDAHDADVSKAFLLKAVRFTDPDGKPGERFFSPASRRTLLHKTT